MTPDKIRAARERAEKATPGDWTLTNFSWGNAEFIRHAFTDVPALCDALDEAREALAETLGHLEAMLDDSDDVDANKIPAIAAATLVRARQTVERYRGT